MAQQKPLAAQDREAARLSTEPFAPPAMRFLVPRPPPASSSSSARARSADGFIARKGAEGSLYEPVDASGDGDDVRVRFHIIRNACI